MDFTLRPLSTDQVTPYRRSGADRHFDALFEAVSAFYAGHFDAADQRLGSILAEDPRDMRALFFSVMIPFLRFYFLEDEHPEAGARFFGAFKSLPEATSNEPLDLLMRSGLYGYASLAALKNNQPMDAARYGLEGIGTLRRMPGQADSGHSLIGRGLSSFLAGSAPFPVRLSFVAQGITASREEGIRLLEQAARAQSLISADALLILTQLYQRMGEHGLARKAARALTAAYPDNRVYSRVADGLA